MIAWTTVNLDDVVFHLTADGTPPEKGKYEGSWEDSWPSYDGDWRIIKVMLDDQDVTWIMNIEIMREAIYAKADFDDAGVS